MPIGYRVSTYLVRAAAAERTANLNGRNARATYLRISYQWKLLFKIAGQVIDSEVLSAGACCPTACAHRASDYRRRAKLLRLKGASTRHATLTAEFSDLARQWEVFARAADRVAEKLASVAKVPN